MKVIECNDFNTSFPENFTWSQIDNISLINITNDIVNHIAHEFRTDPERIFISGLRRSLLIIAKYATI